MRPVVVGLAIVSCCIAGCQQTEEIADMTWYSTEIAQRKEYTQEPPPDLASIPKGIDVTFSENPVKPQGPFSPSPSGGPRYTLREYDVSVVSATVDVHVERWGIVEIENWTSKHAEFSVADFSESFGCCDAILKSGQKYTYNTAEEIGSLPGKVKWYFIARDGNGAHVKGEALVQSAAEEPDSIR